MQQVEERNQAKIDHYVDLLLDQEKLVRASQGIIRKKHSPLARKISSGDVRAIMRAAKDRIFGALSKEQRFDLCKILCDLKNKVNEFRREAIAYAIEAIIGLFISHLAALIIGFLWLIRKKIESAICSCRLSGACHNGACV